MSSEVTTMTTLATRYEPIGGGERDYATLLRAAERARFVLLGEATRGSHELYAERARITRMLIERHGFDAVAVEADWPDAYRVNRFVRGEPGDANARAALSGFERFPTWMWRNAVVLDFVAWLREHNLGPSAVRPVGFYGLDMYSLYTSIGLVLAHLDRVDPAAARAARDCYATYSRFGDDALAYGLAALRGLVPSSMVRCEEEVVRRLVAERKALAAGGVAAASRDERFQAERNARLVASAEAYYRAMYRGRDSSWNLR
ncbi:MAG: erythromycin esterase family protein, partial [Myxococcota bacterium]